MSAYEPGKPSPLACGEFESLVSPYLDGELPRGEHAGIERHLDECPACKGLAEQFRKLDRLAISSLGAVPEVSAREWSQVWEAIQRGVGPRSLPAPLRARAWLVPALSAAALFLLGVWLVFALVSSRSHRPGEPDISQYPEIQILPSSTKNAIPKVQNREDSLFIDYFSG